MNPTFTPTPEQLAIADTVRDSRDNIIINALAGSAKTTTLEYLARTVLNNRSTLCLAFNAAIKKEMEERLPSHCTAKTFNGIGYQALLAKLGIKHRQCKTNSKKCLDLLRTYISSLDPVADEAVIELLDEDFMRIAKAIDLAKNLGYSPDLPIRVTPLLEGLDDLHTFTPEDFTPAHDLAINTVLRWSFNEAMNNHHIDFNDQVYLPVLLGLRYASYPITFCDEAQDLSPVNHEMLNSLVGRKRLIAVGDRYQAIYAFRGAMSDSMDVLRTRFDMTPLNLTVSFRASKRVAAESQWRAPSFRARDDAPGGTIRHLPEWSARSIPDHAFILCPYNGPLFAVAIRLIQVGKRPQLRGDEMLSQMQRQFRRLTSRPDLPADELTAKVAAYAARQQGKDKYIDDRVDCMMFLCEGRTLLETFANIELLKKSRGTISLLTIHKSKGLEAKDVYLLGLASLGDPDELIESPDPLTPEEEQKLNLRYVAQTRSMLNLTYLNPKGMIRDD